MFKTLFSMAIACMLCVPCAVRAADFTEGKHYYVVDEPGRYQESNKIEVLMFLWYGCSGCYKLDQKITAWAEKLPDDVDFKRLPALFFPNWEFHGRVFLCLEKMGYTYEQHNAIFGIVQKKDQPEGQSVTLEDEKDLPAFLEHIGADKERFMALYASDEITDIIQEIHFMIARFAVHAVPAIVVNGKYRFTIKDVEGKQFLELADVLIQKERGAQQR